MPMGVISIVKSAPVRTDFERVYACPVVESPNHRLPERHQQLCTTTIMRPLLQLHH